MNSLNSSFGLSGILTPYHTKPWRINFFTDSLRRNGNKVNKSEMYINYLDFLNIKFGLRSIFHTRKSQFERLYE